MHEVKFAAIVILVMLTLALTIWLPRHAKDNRVYNRSRWMLAAGTAILATHYIIQYTVNPRATSDIFADIANLLFEIPVVALNCVAIVSLQRQLKPFSPSFWLPAVLAVVVTWGIVAWAACLDEGITTQTTHTTIAFIVSGAAYMIMQAYYVIVYIRNSRRMRRVLRNYFDYDIRVMLQWLDTSVIMLGLMAVFTPLILIADEMPMAIYTLFILFFIFYFIVGFICYGVAGAPKLVEAAEKNALEAKMEEVVEDDQPVEQTPTVSSEESLGIEQAIARWVAAGGYLRGGITMATVTSEMGLPRDQLTQWLKTTEWELFSPWLAHLRIEHAKQILQQHPEWTNEAVADLCGFSSRVYFQQAFKKATGVTPTQYAMAEKGG